MNVRNLFLACSLPILMAFQGCPTIDFDIQLEIFSHPLVAPNKSVVPNELVGSFIESQALLETEEIEDIFDVPVETTESTTIVHVGRAGGKFPKGFLRFVYVEVPMDSKGTISSSSEVFFVKKVGARFIAHLPIVQGKAVSPGESWDESKCDGYLLAEIRMLDDAFELRYFNLDLLDRLIKSKQIKIEIGEDKMRMITNSAESLTKLITKHGDQLFDDNPQKYTRIKLDKTNE